MTCLGYNGNQICVFGNLRVKVKINVIRLIKEVKRIMVNCQNRDLKDIKQEDYMPL